MSQQDTLRHQVAELLEAQQSTLSELNSLLDSETDILREREPVKVEELASTKLGFVRSLEQQGSLLSSLLQQQGLTPGADGINQLMQNLSLTEHWQRCVSLLQQCREHNAMNGGLIEASRNTNERIMDLLHGQTMTPRLYGASGKFDSGSGSGPLAQA